MNPSPYRGTSLIRNTHTPQPSLQEAKPTGRASPDAEQREAKGQAADAPGLEKGPDPDASGAPITPKLTVL